MDREELICRFDIEGTPVQCERYGNGHINDTFLVQCEEAGRVHKYILQKINKSIFKEPRMLMGNIEMVTDYLRKVIREENGDEERETLRVVRTKDGKPYYIDDAGEYWRVYYFIRDAICFEKVEKPEDFYESAVAFGEFQRKLSGFDASQLYEVIPDFHNTPKRYQDFMKAMQADRFHRVQSVSEEITFVINHKEEMGICQKLLEGGKLPLRVTHNDTKLNNILMDANTHKGLCVIDLDTVMPGLSIFDFGDSIRFGANTAAEDETDLNKVTLNLELFELYVKGFLKGCGGKLTPKEIEMLPYGAKIMTLECGMRFLTDYLQGDSYFKIHRENHNLDRCRNQFALVRDMEKKWDAMEKIVNRYAKEV